ncbi:hypothetical protein [Janthinobacterium sp. UMAB-60]|uniref:hypothetical protein n=1 Tax=Janthinobacterium sp. UMAB-60 TaxID=1365365 RepID=UPI001C58667A|nr:hypothetical protein [Janthinobacterium sp. UMAB-60]
MERRIRITLKRVPIVYQLGFLSLDFVIFKYRNNTNCAKYTALQQWRRAEKSAAMRKKRRAMRTSACRAVAARGRLA